MPRTATVVVLLGLAAVGLRARESVQTDSAAGPLARHAALLPLAAAGVAVAAALGLLVVLGLRVGRAKDDEQRVGPVYITGWSRLLGLLTGLAVIAAVGTVVLVGASRISPEPTVGGSPGAPTPGSTSAPRTGVDRTGSSQTSWLPLAALAGFAALAVTAVGLARRDRPPLTDGPAEAVEEGRAESEKLLRTALTAGEQRLAGSAGDPRSGIVESYQAMELALGGAGTPPEPTDTPADVLERVVALRPAAGPAAERLTMLFREARYSLHPLKESDRTDALGALSDLRRVLEDPR